MRKMSFYRKDKNNSTLQSLSNALTNKKSDTINTSGANFGGYGNSNQNSGDNWGEGAGQLFNGAAKLVSGARNSGLFDKIGGSEGSGLFSSAANDYISGSGGSDLGIFGNAIASGGGGSSSAIGSAIGSEVGSGLASEAGSSGWGGFGGFGGGSGGGAPWGLIGKVGKMGYNGISGKDDTEYSDLEEEIIYPLQGASMGASFGPWGALGGALYGIGYGLKDDIGLKDNDWLTTILLPIGMGDEHKGLIQL